MAKTDSEPKGLSQPDRMFDICRPEITAGIVAQAVRDTYDVNLQIDLIPGMSVTPGGDKGFISGKLINGHVDLAFVVAETQTTNKYRILLHKAGDGTVIQDRELVELSEMVVTERIEEIVKELRKKAK